MLNAAVAYYSNTDRSKNIARYFAEKLGYALYDIYRLPHVEFHNLVLVFPVHCQSLPDAVKTFLARIQTDNLALIATYGKMCRGNALYEAQHNYKHNIIAAAYVPAKHTYLQDSDFTDFQSLDPILQKIRRPSPIRIPKSYKNIFSGFFKKQRTRIGVKIIKTNDCDNCGVCGRACNLNAIDNGIPDKRCIRCLKCVNVCPARALEYKLSPFMKLYLKKKERNDLVIYI